MDGAATSVADRSLNSSRTCGTPHVHSNLSWPSTGLYFQNTSKLRDSWYEQRRFDRRAMGAIAAVAPTAETTSLPPSQRLPPHPQRPALAQPHGSALAPSVGRLRPLVDYCHSVLPAARRVGVGLDPCGVTDTDDARWLRVCLWREGPERIYSLRTRNRRMVTAPDRVLPSGSRSILGRPGDEKRIPSPSSTGRTYTRISSTRPCRRH